MTIWIAVPLGIIQGGWPERLLPGGFAKYSQALPDLYSGLRSCCGTPGLFDPRGKKR